MGFVVVLIIFGLVGFFVGIAKALDSTDAGNGQGRGYGSEHGWCDADFDED